MSREAIERARQLIRSGRYRAARKLLEPLDSLDADELLLELDMLESQRPSLLRSGYGLLVLLGLLIPVVLALGLFTLAGGFDKARVILAVPTALPTPLPTLTHTPTQTPSRTPTPTPTLTPSDTPMLTHTSTWTPTTWPITRTPDATGTVLANVIATGQAFVAATGTMAARNALLRSSGTQVLGIVGTPDEACAADSRIWWRNARLIAADAFFNLVDDYHTTVALVLEQPTQYRGLIEGMNVDFLSELRNETMLVGYPPCAHTARAMLLAYMQECILSFQSIRAGDHPKYVERTEQAKVYEMYFERELNILRVARQ